MWAAIMEGKFIAEMLDVRLPIGFFLRTVAVSDDNDKVTLLSGVGGFYRMMPSDWYD